jgi:hypothetical protein
MNTQVSDHNRRRRIDFSHDSKPIRTHKLPTPGGP